FITIFPAHSASTHTITLSLHDALPIFLTHQEVDHFSHRQRCARVQVVVEAHGDVVRGRFRARPLEMHVLADHELKRADERSFKRDRKSTRLNSSHLVISYAVFCLNKKT